MQGGPIAGVLPLVPLSLVIVSNRALSFFHSSLLLVFDVDGFLSTVVFIGWILGAASWVNGCMSSQLIKLVGKY